MSSELYCDLFIAPRMMLPGDALFMVVSFRVCSLDGFASVKGRSKGYALCFALGEARFFLIVFSVFYSVIIDYMIIIDDYFVNPFLFSLLTFPCEGFLYVLYFKYGGRKMNIGERIRFLRKDSLSLTMEKFGERLGVTKVAISNIESGNRSVTDQMFTSICREFHVRPEWLRDGEEPIFAERDQNDLINEYIDDILSDDERADPIAVKLIETLAKMDHTSLKAVYDFCETWVRSVEEKEAAEQQKESRPLGTPEGIAEAEAAYEKHFGIPSPTTSSISGTGDAGRKDA